MPTTYCTLFNSNYLSRGIVLARTLRRHSPDARLVIFGFDQPACDTLRRLDLPGVTVVSLDEFEDPELLRVKPTRTAAEYCWTSTPSTILYCIERLGAAECTYLDADMMFFSDPAVLIREMGTASVMIPPHRYTPKYDQSAVSGIYCVQFVTFRDTTDGMRALRWWRDSCLEWCYARPEPGRFGDQKYLDDWPIRFSGVHVLQHLGGGLAPWNVQQYRFDRNRETVAGVEISTGKKFGPVFYHFHHMRFEQGGFVDLGPYPLDSNVRDYFYSSYLGELEIAAAMARDAGFKGDSHGSRPSQNGLLHTVKRIKHWLEGRNNRFQAQQLLKTVSKHA